MLALSGYDNLKVIHEGHKNIVYTALRINDQKSVIIKTLRSLNPTAEDIALLYHEYEVTKGLDCPTVIKTYEMMEAQNNYALIQEDIHGIPLKEHLKEKGIKDLGEFYELALQMIHAIAEIHQNHIIHKDIKPGNFIINPETHNLKITDFNLSTKLPHEVQDVVPPEKLEGTLLYMAPEQTGRLNMNIDYRSDYYALGVTLYEMLTGKLPFHSQDPLEIIHAHLTVPPPDASKLNSNIPKILSQIIQKLMAKEPSNRYQSTAGIQFDLERCSRGDLKSFPLGRGEKCDRLNLSQTVYGREKEAETLLEAYKRVSNGSVEALMISGYSGIGKTMLVNEVHKPMVKNKGYFAQGKFDQLNRNTPYTAITQALNQLARSIMAEPKERFEAIKSEILNEMGDVAQVMIDLAPDLELILGKQPPLPVLSPRQTQNRMMTFFKRFIGVVATSEHPLVLFIDDLQWVDSGSLKLFEFILADSDITHVFLIGSYRSNEVEEHHPLKLFLKAMENTQATINHLPLSPLKPSDFCSFLKDSFDRDENSVKPLAELIHKRTGGNPFFLKQIIQTLYRNELLYFDYEIVEWDWNFEGIKKLSITENVADLMVSKIAELPPETVELLKLAVCIGNRFTIDTLQKISHQSADIISKTLWPALQNELLFTLEHGYRLGDALGNASLSDLLGKEIIYRFSHDKIQEAVYRSIPLEIKELTHLSIARSLMEREPESSKNERLFEVVDHYNKAHPLLDKNERLLVAALNDQAGMRALRSNAYQPMLNYFKTGLAITNERWWTKKYELMFQLNRGYLQSLYLTGDSTKAHDGAKTLLMRAKKTLDKISVYRIQCIHYQSEANHHKALAIILKSLKLLGIKIHENPSRLSIHLKFQQIKWALRRHNITTLERELPPLKNPNIIATFEIISESIYLILWVPGNMYVYLALVAMQLMLKYGKPPSGGLWVTMYALAVLNYFNNVRDTFILCDLAERMMDENPDKYTSAVAYSFRAHFINHLRYPFKNSEEYYHKGFQCGLDSGNLVAAAINLSSECSNTQWAKKSIEQLELDVQNALDFSRKVHYQDEEKLIEILIIFAHNLTSSFSDDSEMLNIYDSIKTGENPFIQSGAEQYLANYYFFSERYDLAYKYHLLWYKEEKRCRYVMRTFNCKALDAISISKILPHAPFLKRIKYRNQFQKLQKDLDWAAQKCPHNYLHQHLILKAIQSIFKKDHFIALKNFNNAIENAKKGDFYIWVAIANELAGELCEEHNLQLDAATHLKEAYYYYERYGMLAKLELLQKRYPQHFLIGHKKIDKSSDMEEFSATSTSTSSLDFSSIIKASQSISGEIILEKLFEKMLHITIENAGAQKGVFIEKQEDKWVISASIIHKKDLDEFSMDNTPLDKYEEVPKTILDLCIRTKEPTIIDNARNDERFKSDLYVNRIDPKSLLCLPIIHQNKIIAVIYLENNLTTGAFNEQRIAVLKTLAAQIAISLENARSLERMELLYRATERFVPKPFLKMLQKEHVEDVKLGDSMEVTLTTLFSDIRGYTTIVERQNPQEAFAFVNSYLKEIAPIIRKHNGFINAYLGDAIMALFPGTADDAVKAVISLRKELASYNKKLSESGLPTLEVGYGLNTGSAMIGTIGEEERMDANVISDSINLASRVESLNKYYGTSFLITNYTLNTLENKNQYITRLVDKVKVKGKKEVVYLYELYFESVIDPKEEQFIKIYEESFQAYTKGLFAQALSGFRACQDLKPSDKSASILIERCEQFKQKTIPDNWDGTFEMAHK